MGAFRRSSAAVVTAALTLVGTTSACSPGGRGGDRVTVLAASSLTEVFEDLEPAYEQQHPGADLVVSPGGSPSLAVQAREGAPAAVLITADALSMQRAISAGAIIGEPKSIATNRVTIAVPANRPGPMVDRPDDLADPELLVALCAPEVPCGSAALELLTAAGVTVEPDSLETSVRGVVSRLRLGEVDAGVVYHTDVAGSNGVLRAIDDDVADDIGAVRYLAAALDAEPGGRSVIDFLLGTEGQRILAEHGFGQP